MRKMKTAKTILLTVFRVMIVITVFTLFSEAIRNHLNYYVLANRRVSAEIEYADGRNKIIEEPNGLDFGKADIGDTVTLHVKLPSGPMIRDGVLAFTVSDSTVEVMYHGNLLGAYGQKEAREGKPLYTQYCFVPVPDSVWGDEFIIILQPAEKNALNGLASHLYIYSKNMAYALPLRAQPITFFISVILMAFSIFGLLSCLLNPLGNTIKRWIYICLTALLLSMWMFCSYGFYRIFGFSEHICEPLNYIAGFMIAIPALLLYGDIAKEETNWHRFFLTTALIIAIADLIVITLNFTDALHFLRTEKIMYVLIVVCIIMIAVYSFLHRNQNEANRKLFKGVAVFLISALADVCYLLIPAKGIPVYFVQLTSLGVLFLFVYWVAYIIEDYWLAKSESMLLIANNEKLKSELALSRIRMMTSQMQPHFLYNALSSIRQIVYEDPEYAGRLLADFTVHLRAAVRALSNDRPILFSEELRNIKAYVNIEKVRLGDRLSMNYDIQTDDFSIIPFSIQPLVENAIRHGIFHKPEGSVTLKSYDSQEAWIVQVIDNGAGFDVKRIFDEVEDGTRDSTGLKNLIFRLKSLMDAQIQIESIIGKGTTVTVLISKQPKEIG